MNPNVFPAPELRSVVSVKLAIANPAGNYLLLTRATTDKNRPGTADLPGGGVDRGESPLEAGIREVHEELGIELQAEQLELEHCLEGFSFYGHLNQRHFGRVALTENAPAFVLNPKEHSAWLWLPKEEAYAQLRHPQLREGFALATGIFDTDRV